jgi:hypothetical protein
MIELLQEGMAPLGVITPIPWLLVLLQDIPGVAAGPKRFTKFHLQQIAARKKVSAPASRYKRMFTKLLVHS